MAAGSVAGPSGYEGEVKGALAPFLQHQLMQWRNLLHQSVSCKRPVFQRLSKESDTVLHEHLAVRVQAQRGTTSAAATGGSGRGSCAPRSAASGAHSRKR